MSIARPVYSSGTLLSTPTAVISNLGPRRQRAKVCKPQDTQSKVSEALETSFVRLLEFDVGEPDREHLQGNAIGFRFKCIHMFGYCTSSAVRDT